MDIGRGLSRVLEVNCKAILSDQARFLWLWVEIPLKKPLHRGGLVVNPEGNKVLVAFKYERLDGLCFNCGLLGHEARICPHKNIDKGPNPYGEWLKAGNKQRSEPESRKAPTSSPTRAAKVVDDEGKDQPRQTSQSITAVELSNVGATNAINETIMETSTHNGAQLISGAIFSETGPQKEELNQIDTNY